MWERALPVGADPACGSGPCLWERALPANFCSSVFASIPAPPGGRAVLRLTRIGPGSQPPITDGRRSAAHQAALGKRWPHPSLRKKPRVFFLRSVRVSYAADRRDRPTEPLPVLSDQPCVHVHGPVEGKTALAMSRAKSTLPAKNRCRSDAFHHFLAATPPPPAAPTSASTKCAK